ncbi:MAG: hypothetical protein ACPHUL_00870 [Marinomonas gallaica]
MAIKTSENANTMRLRVDSQQTSFEENRQFKFYDDCTGADAIPTANILIYRFTSTYPLKLQLRLINGIAGARKYTVYPTGGETITGGSFADVTAEKVSPVNNDLSVSGLSSHPVSGVTIEKRIATSFVTTAPKRTGTAYKADTNNNRATSSYTASGNASGVAAGNSFYLVFEDMNGADPSEFLFQLEWEERP